MGASCCKNSKNAPQEPQQVGGLGGSVQNMLVKQDKKKKDTELVGVDDRNLKVLKKVKHIKGAFLYSLTEPPSSQQLLKRMWIQKRGHLFRTWRWRYCVMEKSWLKYYKKPHNMPPYGKNCKGQVALTGATCITTFVPLQNQSDQPHSNSRLPCCQVISRMEIVGNLGNKDLMFDFDQDDSNVTHKEYREDDKTSQDAAEEWVRAMDWATRLMTLSNLVNHHLQNSSGSEKKKKDDVLEALGGGDDDDEDGVLYRDWIENEYAKFSQALTNLSKPRLVLCVSRDQMGVPILRWYSIKLWSVAKTVESMAAQNHLGDYGRSSQVRGSTVKDSSTAPGSVYKAEKQSVEEQVSSKYGSTTSKILSAKLMGLSWQAMDVKNGTIVMNYKEPPRQVSFANISQILVHKAKKDLSKYAKDFATSSDTSPSSQAARPRKRLVISLCTPSMIDLDCDSGSAHRAVKAKGGDGREGQPLLELSACCIHDYDGFFIHLQNTLLFLDMHRQIQSAVNSAVLVEPSLASRFGAAGVALQLQGG